jgi:type I restriction enzyme R subunit
MGGDNSSRSAEPLTNAEFADAVAQGMDSVAHAVERQVQASRDELVTGEREVRLASVKVTGARMAESHVEEAALEWFDSLGYATAYGPDISPGGSFIERDSYAAVFLLGRLQGAIARLNPHIPYTAYDDAVRKLTRRESPLLVLDNRRLHRLLVDGVEVEYTGSDGNIVGDRLRLIDFADAANNDWLAVNQFTVVEGDRKRRPDVVVFVNGIPLGVIELKNVADENATIWSAFNQIQTYKEQIPALFVSNEALVISDGLEARLGSLTSDRERFQPWRTIAGEELAPAGLPQLQVVIEGVFEKRRFLDFVRFFVVYEDDGAQVLKKIAAYHQFWAVQAAVEETLRASRPGGDRRIGVVWHTQGSGKSLTMVFYVGRLVVESLMENPTIVVLTDRNDLDGQLFGVFSMSRDAVRQTPVQAESRDHLRKLLAVASGGVIFTTIQKFFPDEDEKQHPLLSARRNVVVIADEAHRSQYDFIDGFARHMRDALPSASFIGFTGTPIELTDANTRAVFGDYISVYDIQRAVEDGATVPIYYESRLAKLSLDEKEKPRIDPAFEEVTEGEEEQTKTKLRSKWAALEAVVGAEKRLTLIAEDLVRHFEERERAIEGKAMVVSMSRRIAVAIYDAIVKVRPEWHSNDDAMGAIKIIMTGSADDPIEFQRHIRTKDARKRITDRFKRPEDPLQVIIVRDMLLTGFDAPPLHTMYVDKPMKGHGLMQAIARVNRVFRDKPGGLVVDYLGLANELRSALNTYTQSGGKGQTAIDQSEAVAVFGEKYEVVAAMFHGFDWSLYVTSVSQGLRLGVIARGIEFILGRERDEEPGIRERLLKGVREMSLAFALAVPHEDALAVRDDVDFFQSIRAALAKRSTVTGKSPEELDHAVRQIVSKALVSDEVVDIFKVAGLDKPDISILSDEFLAEVRGLPQRNLAIELLQRLINDTIKTRTKRNLVQSHSFSEMLEQTLRKYQNRSIEAAQVIEELIQLAKDIKQAQGRGGELGLNEDEVAFYDALAQNESAVDVLGDDGLKVIAVELVKTVRANVTVDWTIKETVRANLRRLVRRTLKKYGYPPDLEESAVQAVLAQAEQLADVWTAK